MKKFLNVFLIPEIFLTFLVTPILVRGDGADGQDGHMGMMDIDFSFWSWTTMMFLGIGISLLLAFLVYKDAVNNQDPNPMMWAIIVLFTSLLGILLYVLFRSSSRPTQKVSPPREYAGQDSTSDEAPYISYNKRKIAEKNFCKSCGSLLENDAKFCSVCGVDA
jgi:hypothetical protein